jgi:hypothetical protein
MNEQPFGQVPSVQPTSADYLDSIAVKPTNNVKLLSGKMLILFAALAVVLVGAIGLMFSGGGERRTPRADSETLFLRMTNLSTVAGDFQGFLRGNRLRAANATFRTQLASSLTSLTPQLANIGINTQRIDERRTASEQELLDQISQSLENERLNVRLDRSYAREMSYQLEMLLILIERIENSANDEYSAVLTNIHTGITASRENFSRLVE